VFPKPMPILDLGLILLQLGFIESIPDKILKKNK
jgi:hypothetical protein